MSVLKFLNIIKSFEKDINSVSSSEDSIHKSTKQLEEELQAILKRKSANIHDGSSLSLLKNELGMAIKQSISTWNDDIDKAMPMAKLSEAFSDRIILLVFGKVNAGKSSFSKEFIKFFPNESSRLFKVENGVVKYFDGEFKVGATETTSSIQGVEIGKKLILLDSPGLHSVTEENGELTERFVDSADLILWLTPSTSPGQVQELNSLKAELEKNKPLLPVITRSDELEEDEDDEGNLVSIRLNKSPEVRRKQEADVLHRLKDVISGDVARPPVSISIISYEEGKRSDEAFVQSGLDCLFKDLAVVVSEAKEYKVDKAKYQMVNFLSDKVLSTLNEGVSEIARNILKKSKETNDLLKSRHKIVSTRIMSEVCYSVPKIVEKHVGNRDIQAISNELNIKVSECINDILIDELAEFVTEIRQGSIKLDPSLMGDFEDITIDVDVVIGNVKKAAAASGAGLLGAALGSFLLPGVGTVIGGMIGGALGSTAGDYFLDIESHREIVGMSSEKLIEKTEKHISNKLPKIIKNVFDDVNKQISDIADIAGDTLIIVDDFSSEIERIKAQI